MNVDRAFNDGKGGIGVIARDCVGDIIAAASIPLHNPTGPEHVEIVAILSAFQFATDLDLRHFVVESDCAVLVKAVNSLDKDMSMLADFINLAKARLRSPHCLGLHFVKRGCNIPAHLLAIFSYSLCEERYWIEEAPTHVTTATVADISMH